jgi:hypothetical protein
VAEKNTFACSGRVQQVVELAVLLFAVVVPWATTKKSLPPPSFFKLCIVSSRRLAGMLMPT